VVAEWTVINKTLEVAEDKARPAPVVVEPPKPAPKPAPRILPPVPKAFPTPPAMPPVLQRPKPLEPAPVPAASSSRPTIKLKVGSQSKAPERPPERSQPVPKPQKKKPKLSDSPSSLVLDAPPGPPPPYVDDGSHDILQEVLAIEREKNEQRQRSHVEKEKPATSAASGKRKITGDIDEDEILSLATPAKKERPSPPGPSSSKPLVVPPTVPKPTIPSIKVKKEKPIESSRPSSAHHSPVPSVKGKEREVALPVPPVASNKVRKPAQATPIQEKKCKELLKNLVKMPESLIFRQPVDPIRDGCPT